MQFHVISHIFLRHSHIILNIMQIYLIKSAICKYQISKDDLNVA